MYRGKTYPRYLLRIGGAFAAHPNFHIDSTGYVEKLDDEGLSLVGRIFGVDVFRLEHRFGSVGEGATYRSRLAVGAGSGMVRGVLLEYASAFW